MNVRVNIDPVVDRYLKPEMVSEVLVISEVNKFTDESAIELSNSLNRAERSLQEYAIVKINSYGGLVHPCLTMIESMETCSKPVMTFTTSRAMSCGALLLGFGSLGHRWATENSDIMFHHMSNFSSGNLPEMLVAVHQLEKLQVRVFQKLARHCGHTDQDYFLKLLKAEGNTDIYMTPKEAKKHKLIDKIGSPFVEITIGVHTRIV